jgi:hypothetical protein
MGKKSRTPSVEPRVEETKQKFPEVWRILFLLYLHFVYSVSISHSLSPALLLSLFFTFILYRTYLPLVFGFFWPEGPVADQRTSGASNGLDHALSGNSAGRYSYKLITIPSDRCLERKKGSVKWNSDMSVV